MSFLRVPALTNPDIVIRLAQTSQEIEDANRIVYRNYVNLYWPEDEEAFRRNKYLTSKFRRVAVAVDKGRVVGTLSAIEDSVLGLPSDSFHPQLLAGFRAQNARVVEMTSFAIDRSAPHSYVLTLYLMKFFIQFTFYYLGADRLVASCRPKHAAFYRERLCFQTLCEPTPYTYAGNVKCQFVTLDLLEAHLLLSRRYQDASRDENFYHFFYVDEHPNVRFPRAIHTKRSRQLDWAAIAHDQGLALAV